MSAEAIRMTTQAMRARLEAALVDAGGGTVFVGPLDDPNAKGASLILFLYRIAANPSLRNHEHVVVSATPPPEVIVYRTALPLCLHYLVTIGSREDVADEDPLLSVLGYAMQALNDDTKLTGVKVGNETVEVSFDPLSTEEMSRVWTLFPTANYRTSVAYVATPVWIDPKLPPVGAGRVLAQRLGAGVRAADNPEAADA